MLMCACAVYLPRWYRWEENGGGE